MKTLISLLIVVFMSVASVCAAVLTPVPVGGVRMNYDTTGTNTTSSKVTITNQVDLSAHKLSATNRVEVGESGEAGVISLQSTNGTYGAMLTSSSTNWYFSLSGLDDYDNNLFSFISSNAVTKADLFGWFNGPDRVAWIQNDGSYLGHRGYFFDSADDTHFFRAQPNDLTINAGPDTNKFVVDVSNHTITLTQFGTNIFYVAQDSGNDGSTNLFLAADGHYYPAGGDTIWTNDNGTISANSTVVDGGTAFSMNSSNSLSSGYLVKLKNNSSENFSVASTGTAIVGPNTFSSGLLPFAAPFLSFASIRVEGTGDPSAQGIAVGQASSGSSPPFNTLIYVADTNSSDLNLTANNGTVQSLVAIHLSNSSTDPAMLTIQAETNRLVQFEPYVSDNSPYAAHILNTFTNLSAADVLRVQNNFTNILTVPSTGSSNDTLLMLWDVSAGSLVRVTRGAADSGGAGFRVLRIPN